MHFNSNIRDILKSMYRNTTANLDWKGLKIKEIKSEKGLRQGCTLSPLLFTLIMEELIWRVKKVGVGVKINKEILCILTFADDVILIAESMEDLQKMLDEVGKFSEDMKLKFETGKSKIMIVNKKQDNGEERKGKLLGNIGICGRI